MPHSSSIPLATHTARSDCEVWILYPRASKSSEHGTPMNPHEDRVNKTTTIGLLFGAQRFCYMIRYALSIVAPTLMSLYHLSPQTMGYILSGWNWSYPLGL